MFAERCTEGQKVYISGLISYFDFVTSDNKKRRGAKIKANQLYLCDPMDGDTDGTFGMDIGQRRWIDRALELSLHNVFAISIFRCERREIVRTSIAYGTQY